MQKNLLLFTITMYYFRIPNIFFSFLSTLYNHDNYNCSAYLPILVSTTFYSETFNAIDS